MNDVNPEFDWGPHGEVWWRALAKEAGCSSQLCLKWLVAKMVLDCTNTEAARRAEARGGATAAGYRISRSRDTERLRMAYALKTGGDEAAGAVTSLEARRILSKLARGSDPQIKIRALESLARLDAADREAGSESDSDGMSEDRLARDLILSGPGGEVAYVMTALGRGLSNLCLLHDVAQRMERDWPELWAKIVARAGEPGRRELERLLADRDYQLWTRQRIWGECGFTVDPTTNEARRDPQGRSHITPSATRPSFGNADAMRERDGDRAGNGLEASNGKQAPAA